jgi:SAM-dependent methyltransferase
MPKKINLKITPELVEHVTKLATDYATSTGADDPEYYMGYYLKMEPHLGVLEAIVSMLGWKPDSSKTIVELGSGIGTKCLMANGIYGSKVLGVEPYPDTYSGIAQAIVDFQKANPQYQYTALNEFGEHLSLETDSVDYLISHEVMEHVQNTKEVTEEMYRITKPGGQVFIATCNYDSFFDAHYRMFLPPIKTKWFRKLWVRLHGFNTKFVDEINFITKNKLRKLLEDAGFKDITFYIDLDWKLTDIELNTEYPEGFEFKEVIVRKVPFQKFIQKPGVAKFLSRFNREYKMYVSAIK